MKFRTILTAISALALFLLVNTYGLAQADFWEKTNGPYRLEASCIALNSQGHIFVGTGTHSGAGSEGVYRSTDNGTTWISVNNGLDWRLAISHLSIAPDGSIFAGGGADYCSGYLFRSTNNGDSWDLVTGWMGEYCTPVLMQIAPGAQGDIYVGDQYAGIGRSTDSGLSWSFSGIQGEHIKGLAVNSSGHVFATSGQTGISPFGLYRTTNNGNSWTDLNTPLGTSYAGQIAIDTNNTVFVCVPAYLGGIRRSTDNGSTFQPVGTGLLATQGAGSLHIGKGNTLYAATYPGIYRSTDKGTTWQNASAGIDNIQVTSIAGDSARLFAGTDGRGIYRSTDKGDTWISVSQSWPGSRVASLASLSSGRMLAGTSAKNFGGGGVSISDDGGATWVPRKGSGIPSYETVWALAATTSGILFAGTGYGTEETGTYTGVWRSTDGGNTWSQMTNGFSNPYPNVVSLAVSPTDIIFAGTANNGAYRSTDGGNSWGQASNGLTNNSVTALTSTNSNIVFAGTRGGGVYRSTDNGSSWETKNGGLTNLDVHSLGVNKSSGMLFAGTAAGIFNSSDNGTNWSAAGLPMVTVQTLIIAADGRVFAGSPTGVYESTDNGAHWGAVNSGLTTTDVPALALNSEGRLFAGTWGGGVYRGAEVGLPIQLASFGCRATGANEVTLEWSTLSEINNYGFVVQRRGEATTDFADLPSGFIPGHGTTNAPKHYTYVDRTASGKSQYYRLKQLDLDGTAHFSEPVQVTQLPSVTADVPRVFALAQNYPNPFNPETSIRFELPHRTSVRLLIFNTLGQLVSTLVDETRDAGRYEVRWNAQAVASGVYLCKMEAGGFVDMRKLVVVR